MNQQSRNNRANQLNPNSPAYRRSRGDTRAAMGSSKKHPQDARGDIQNANKGTAGTNPIYDKGQGNRGKQLNPNQSPSKPR
ncbi:hypothetical protein M5G25_21500 [Pseudomonas sp. TNT2022 ID357]|uniref:Stress-induced acidophilic repeat motif-containing protein n=1 Tax=Pseudomonas idahonensis TaxID=2942628 RepID=A0ABT5QB73_9PSED|nr:MULTISPECIES: hypothetical protein [Pseudomonas]KAF0864426.1 hypothetical protein PLD_27945 [Pseudomonas sp. LD120]MDC7817891.1 hypothetical protein [Pseudomonas sp. BLCC-B112]MDD1150862.1 hypothetical protein [Pseudomonas idahonensis]